LNLLEALVEEWNHYIHLLSHSSIQISEREDEILWSRNQATGQLIAKHGYEAVILTQWKKTLDGGGLGYGNWNSLLR
jgi:hypothetical protein